MTLREMADALRARGYPFDLEEIFEEEDDLVVELLPLAGELPPLAGKWITMPAHDNRETVSEPQPLVLEPIEERTFPVEIKRS